MIAEMKEALQPLVAAILGRGVEIYDPILVAGGASKEAWAVDADGERLLVRRAAGGVIHRHTLSLADEYAVLEAAHEAGVKAPRPYDIPDLEGREAFVMERLEGDTIGRRIVQKEELAAARDALYRLPHLDAAAPERPGSKRRARHAGEARRGGRVRDREPPGTVRAVTERPTSQELAEAIVEFLAAEILPTLTDPRLRFRMLVAMNALSIVYRGGDVPAGTLGRVKADVEARLRIASPRYLEAYQ